MRRTTAFYIALFVAPLILYISFMSIGLDYFDSFEYAFALDRWETALIQVHPPGYPVYVYSAKFIQLFVQDTRLALTLLSAISGAVTLVVLPILTKAGTNNRLAGFIASVLLIFLPGFWLSSEIALGDIHGLLMTLVAMAFLLYAKPTRSPLIFYAGCLLAGLSLGARPQNGIPVAMAGLVALYNLRPFNHQYMRSVVLGFMAGFIGLILWIIPIYQTFDGYAGYSGFDLYFERLSELRQHNQTTDSLFSQDLTVENVTQRLDEFIDGWIHLMTARSTPLFIAVIGLCAIGLLAIPLRHGFTWFLILWFILDTIKTFLIISMERPRLFLPALLPFIILVGLGYSNLPGRLRFLRVGVIVLVGIFLWISLPLVIQLTRIPAPPEQATHYVLDNYPLKNGTATVVSQGSFQAAQYRLGDYKHLYTPYFEANEWADQIEFDAPDYLIILDGDNIAPEIFEALTTRLNYVPIDDRVFARDPRVFPQHSTVRLQVMIQEKDLQPEQLTSPETGIISTSSPSLGKYFGSGWYRIEDIGGTPGRWTNQVAVMRVTLPAEDTTMTFMASPYLGNQSVDVIVNGETIETIDINEIWGTYHVTIPADIIALSDITTIELHHSQAEYPENHNRRLATAYSQFSFE